jgi:hypothetical protein
MTTATETKPSAFAALLEEINGQATETETLAKSVAGDDAAIAAAAAEGAADGEEEDKDKDKDKDGNAGKVGEPVMKALKVIGADGQESEGVDATDLLKSLLEKTDTLEANSTAGLKAVLGVVKSQGELIKSLHEQVQLFSRQGAGRKSVIAINDKPGATSAEELRKSLEAPAADEKKGMPRAEFFAKALQAAEAGMISYHEANLAETLVNGGGAPPPTVIAAVAKLAAADK